MKLSNELNNIAQGYSFNGKALREAYDSETITTTNDRQMLSRYMHGAELRSDRFRLQDLAIEFSHVRIVWIIEDMDRGNTPKATNRRTHHENI